MRPPSAARLGSIRRTVLLCAALPLALAVQLGGLALVCGGTGQPVDTGRPGGGAWRPSRRAAGRFRWPLDGPPRPVRRFDPPPQPWLPGHRGVDLAAAPAAGGPQRRRRDGALRRAGRRPAGGHRRPRRRPADHLRAGPSRLYAPAAGGRRDAAGRAAARPSGLPGRGLPALGAAPRRRSTSTRWPCSAWARCAAAGRRLRCRRGQRTGAGGQRRSGSAPAVSAGRAAPAAARRAARTRRRCCRPDRTAAASPGRSRRHHRDLGGEPLGDPRPQRPRRVEGGRQPGRQRHEPHGHLRPAGLAAGRRGRHAERVPDHPLPVRGQRGVVRRVPGPRRGCAA